jgi:hypothetical protein
MIASNTNYDNHCNRCGKLLQIYYGHSGKEYIERCYCHLIITSNETDQPANIANTFFDDLKKREQKRQWRKK